MLKIPQTMTSGGLQFLEALASKNKGGVFLEVGPLFGSSTDAIFKGRKVDEPIHSIDTFEDAPWVSKRLGIPLSRAAYDKFTKHIPNLIVHEGFSPDVVTDTWKDKIGFYFDDATHGNPGWLNNFNFFKPYFNDDCIICGDDFAGGWPDIVRNVYKYADDHALKLYVLGRVWALTHKDEKRIEDAIDEIQPILKNTYITAEIGGKTHKNKAGVWSYGLHQKNPIDQVTIDTSDLKGSFTIFKDGEKIQEADFGQGPIRINDGDNILFMSKNKITIQYCIMEPNGRTMNGKNLPSGKTQELKEGQKIVSVRLSEKE